MESELKNLLQVITGRSELPASKQPSIRDALARLDLISADEDADLDPHLRHFLKNRSYAKALQFLDQS